MPTIERLEKACKEWLKAYLDDPKDEGFVARLELWEAIRAHWPELPKIQPCPFCTNQDVMLDSWRTDNGVFLFYVRCKACSAVGPHQHDKINAINTWNDARRQCPSNS